MAALAGSAVAAASWSPAEAVGESVPGSPVVAIAAGAAFTFRYAEADELLRAAGAQPVSFDPLTDPLPAGAAAVVLPGGFPEQYPEELFANSTLRAQIRGLADHAPVHAECGGLTYLMDDLDGHRMCGVLPGSARFTDRLTLGYRDAVAATASSQYAAGARVTGHEFHRTAVEFGDPGEPAWLLRGADGRSVAEGAVRAGVHASYLHVHPAAQPLSTRRFVERAAVTILER